LKVIRLNLVSIPLRSDFNPEGVEKVDVAEYLVSIPLRSDFNHCFSVRLAFPSGVSIPLRSDFNVLSAYHYQSA